MLKLTILILLVIEVYRTCILTSRVGLHYVNKVKEEKTLAYFS